MIDRQPETVRLREGWSVVYHRGRQQPYTVWHSTPWDRCEVVQFSDSLWEVIALVRRECEQAAEARRILAAVESRI